jgi:thioester reductase-like protein
VKRQDDKLLLTGATGFVGMEVLARYLERSDRSVVTLVRAPSDAEAKSRIDAVLADLFGRRARRYARRVEAVAADLTAPDLGLDSRARDALAGSVNEVIHAAASVSFALPLDESRAINVTGTERVLDLAERTQELGGLRRFAYVSTAFVSGLYEGTFTEADLDLGQDFRNPYERSKLEAEQLVRERAERLPVTILRPSIVVGDRRSGWTASFNVLYAPLRAFARGHYPAVPAVASAPVDVVSVDYVADAIHSVCSGHDGLGETYHLTAGTDASTVGDLVELATTYFHRPLRVLDPDVFERDVAPEVRRHGSPAQRAVLQRSQAYFPYFRMAVRFDNRRARSRLEPAGIRAAPLREYFSALVDHAVAARWGRRPISRAQARARLAGI